MRTIFKKMTFAGVALCGFAGVGFAQPTPAQIQQQQFQQQQQMMNAIRSDNMRNCGDEHGHGCRRRNTGPSASEVRAWHARERKIQAEIAQLRATPFYMAVAYDFVTNQSMWGGGYYSEKRAAEETLKQCKSSNCQLITTFSNTCAVFVEPDRRAKTIEDIFVAFDKDDKQAALKAMRSCEAKHGANNCSYWQVKKPFCTGYDYSIYGQK